MLQTLDEMNIIPRSKEKTVKQFVLLDGHCSQLEMPFLRYFNNPEDQWIAYIGVPYGTVLWQVGDSKEQNGSFNMVMTKEKKIIDVVVKYINVQKIEIEDKM